jgi:hypothetical protein
MNQNNLQSNDPHNDQNDAGLSGFIRAAGTILAVSYPVLALSTGFRALYQIVLISTGARADPYLPSILSALAGLCYLTATVGFAVRKKWAWQLSVGVLGFETVMTLLIGTLSFIYPDVIGSTVWRAYGADYGFFPLVQPILGLAWLFHPATLHTYNIRKRMTLQQ